MKLTKKEETILKIMNSLKCSREEAEQVFEDDEAIDKGEKLFELDPEREKASKKARNIGTKTTTKEPPKADTPKAKTTTTKTKTKKDNPTKARIIETLFKAIQELEGVTNAENPNVEKTITFELDGNKFEIDLKQKRQPKA